MRSTLVRAVALVAVAFVAACSDKSPTGSSKLDSSPPPGACTTLSNLASLTRAVFVAGSLNATSVLDKLDNLQSQLKTGNSVGAQDQARSIVSFVHQKAEEGALTASQTQVQTLISSVLCYVGLSPDTYLVQPTDAPRVLLTADKKAGVSLQANTVTEPTLITITTLPTDVSPLDTKLDAYPGYVLITQSATLTKPVVVGVCPASSVPASVVPRLRLGHQKSSGFEITPAADASFLDCSLATAQSQTPAWLRVLVSLVTPKPAYAARRFAGGVGGLATEFSPFGPVDTELRFSGGVGGTATEFQQSPSPRVNSTTTSGACAAVTAPVGGALDPECRPGVTLKTANGTVMQNVPIGWAIGLGGGVIAPEASGTRTCGAFSSNAATATDATGKAGVCWKLGPTADPNTTIATPSVGGDAPAGVSFNPATITFSASVQQITPTVNATGGTFTFDALAHPGSGTCSNSLTPAFTYSAGSPPSNVGVYTLTVTCGAGNPAYKTVSQTASIEIKPAEVTIKVTCPSVVTFTGAALTPCTATATGPGLTQTLAVTYTSNTNAGTATATATYAGGGNYLPSNGSSTFQIGGGIATTASVHCPPFVLYTGSPVAPCSGEVNGPDLSLAVTPTYSSNVVGTATATVNYLGGGNYLPVAASRTFQIYYVQTGFFTSLSGVLPSQQSFVAKGTTVSVNARLFSVRGDGVSGASGDITVQDLGGNGFATPATVFSRTNAFTAGPGGSYSYDLATDGFAAGHFYFVTAAWNDGSRTGGWFYLK